MNSTFVTNSSKKREKAKVRLKMALVLVQSLASLVCPLPLPRYMCLAYRHSEILACHQKARNIALSGQLCIFLLKD